MRTLEERREEWAAPRNKEKGERACRGRTGRGVRV
jgi:hypothetical protein